MRPEEHARQRTQDDLLLEYGVRVLDTLTEVLNRSHYRGISCPRTPSRVAQKNAGYASIALAVLETVLIHAVEREPTGGWIPQAGGRERLARLGFSDCV